MTRITQAAADAVSDAHGAKALEAEIRRKAFNAGYVIACCNLDNMHGHPEVAFDVLAPLGVTRREIKEMDLSDYDMKALRRIERGRSGTPYADGRRLRARLKEQST